MNDLMPELQWIPYIYASYYIYFNAKDESKLNQDNYNVVIDILNR